MGVEPILPKALGILSAITRVIPILNMINIKGAKTGFTMRPR